MKDKLVKLNNEQLENIGGSGIWAALIPLIPLAINAISSLAATYKTLTSSSGEYKTKDTSHKWDSDNKSSSRSSSSSSPIVLMQY
ncbi:hypothetical protein [[Mycoplasma] collis]|uniref:hypothetical protein n=1 Tax=[Mycoplasma] collis TaxID=2127 RepID=UPI00051BB073|nr:hypothetical protein [[Mycoplasma] collis]